MFFTIWLTTECNLQCTYCYEGSEKKQGIMSMETAQAVIDFIYLQIITQKTIYSYLSIDFLGGEPLLNYEVMCYIIEKVRSWQLAVPVYISMTTNATLLTKEKIAYLINSLDEISMSIDGDKQTHDMYRKFSDGSGSYKIVIENIRELLKYQKSFCNFRARMTIRPETAKLLYENVNYMIDLGFKTIVPVMDRFIDWTQEEADCLYTEMIKIYEKFIVNRKDLFIGLVDDITLRRESLCLGGEITLQISPNGVIFPCSYVMGQDNFAFGDVQNGVQNEKKEWIKKINNMPMTESCNFCAWQCFCNGNRCRLLNYATTGDFTIPSAATCLNERLQLKLCREYYRSEKRSQ